jgi:hypothetical protein
MKPAEINLKWAALQNRIATEFDNEKPDIKVVMFLIGVQELGQGPKKFSKRQKEELMHIANCKLFSKMGFYELEGLDQDGWPHWKLAKTVPNYTILEQEMLIKSLIIDYFESEMEWGVLTLTIVHEKIFYPLPVTAYHKHSLCQTAKKPIRAHKNQLRQCYYPLV